MRFIRIRAQRGEALKVFIADGAYFGKHGKMWNACRHCKIPCHVNLSALLAFSCVGVSLSTRCGDSLHGR
jgi:hypothetical protein